MVLMRRHCIVGPQWGVPTRSRQGCKSQCTAHWSLGQTGTVHDDMHCTMQALRMELCGQ